MRALIKEPLNRLRQENHEFESSLGNLPGPHVSKKKNKLKQ
jgi:hypothetical protein